MERLLFHGLYDASERLVLTFELEILLNVTKSSIVSFMLFAQLFNRLFEAVVVFFQLLGLPSFFF
jgi:hypothetical protein